MSAFQRFSVCPFECQLFSFCLGNFCFLLSTFCFEFQHFSISAFQHLPGQFQHVSMSAFQLFSFCPSRFQLLPGQFQLFRVSVLRLQSSVICLPSSLSPSLRVVFLSHFCFLLSALSADFSFSAFQLFRVSVLRPPPSPLSHPPISACQHVSMSAFGFLQSPTAAGGTIDIKAL